MHKTSQDIGSALTYGADAFAVGAGAAAIIALIRQAAEANRQRKLDEKRRSDKVDPNTIVLTIGANHRKLAEDTGCKATNCESSAVVPKVEPGIVSNEIKPSVTQPRKPNGQYTSFDSSISSGDSEKQAGGPMTQATNILASIGGSVAGYVVISKIAERLEQKRLQKQVDAAQKEYIDLLSGNTKVAQAFSDLFMVGDDSVAEFEKSAGVVKDIVTAPSAVAGLASDTGGVAIASYILAAGGAAYIVKRLLEERFGKDEEKPEPRTRILFKAGSSEFEMEPEHMLATVGILKDCIADSMPEKVAQANDIDYGWLDELSKVDGGRQYILDQYANSQGLSREDSNFGIPVPILTKYGPSMQKYVSDPDAYAPSIRSYVLNMMKNDPESWFRMLGQKNNYDLVRFKADEQIKNLQNGTGWKATLASIPIIGPMFKAALSSWLKNSKYGRREMARQSLETMGVPTEQINDIVSKYDFSSPEGWSPAKAAATAQKKSASVLGEAITWSSRFKNVKDNTNKEILDALRQLKEEQESNGSRGKKKQKKNNKVVVEFSDDVKEMLPPESRRRLAAALEE